MTVDYNVEGPSPALSIVSNHFGAHLRVPCISLNWSPARHPRVTHGSPTGQVEKNHEETRLMNLKNFILISEAFQHFDVYFRNFRCHQKPTCHTSFVGFRGEKFQLRLPFTFASGLCTFEFAGRTGCL
jgi:hypothetical protein